MDVAKSNDDWGTRLHLVLPGITGITVFKLPLKKSSKCCALNLHEKKLFF